MYKFDNFHLDSIERTLWADSEPTTLSGKPFDILVFLVENHGKLVTRERIMDSVWKDTIVEEGNLDVHLSAIRRVIGSDYIQNVPRQGFRFVGNVTSTDSQSVKEAADKRVDRTKVWALVIVVSIVCILLFGVRQVRQERQKSAASPAQSMYAQALEYQEQGDDEQALTALDQATVADPKFAEAHLRAAFVAFEIGRSQSSSDYLAKASLLAPKMDQSLQLKAKALRYELDDNDDAALATYQLLIDSYPSDREGLYYFAGTALRLGRLAEAENALLKCVSQDSANPYCRYLMMMLRIKQNQFSSAIAGFEGQPLEVKYVWLYELQGAAYVGHGDFVNAEKRFRLLNDAQGRMHGTSHHSYAKEWIADMNIMRGRFTEGIRALDELAQTTSIASERGRLLAYIARLQTLAGNRLEASTVVDSAIAATDDPSVLSSSVDVLALLGKREQAESLLAEHEQHPNAPKVIKQFVRGALALAIHNDSEAIRWLQAASDSDPDDLNVRYALATAMMREGRWDDAIPHLVIVSESRGKIIIDYPPILLPLATLSLAKCYEKKGDAAKAAEYDTTTRQMLRDGESSFEAKLRAEVAAGARKR